MYQTATERGTLHIAEQSPRFVAEEKPKKRVSVKEQIAEKQAAIAPKERSVSLHVLWMPGNF